MRGLSQVQRNGTAQGLAAAVRQVLRVECVKMPTDKADEIRSIRERLRLVSERFEREMRERGFDPEQAENVPLTPLLAKLYLEQTDLRSKLSEMTREQEKQ